MTDAPWLAGLTHKQYLARIRDWCDMGGWEHFVVWDSRHSPAGWPDIVAFRGEARVAIEVKIPPDRLRPDQQHWLEVLELAGFQTYVAYPADADTIRSRLLRGSAAPDIIARLTQRRRPRRALRRSLPRSQKVGQVPRVPEPF